MDNNVNCYNYIEKMSCSWISNMNGHRKTEVDIITIHTYICSNWALKYEIIDQFGNYAKLHNLCQIQNSTIHSIYCLFYYLLFHAPLIL